MKLLLTRVKKQLGMNYSVDAKAKRILAKATAFERLCCQAKGVSHA